MTTSSHNNGNIIVSLQWVTQAAAGVMLEDLDAVSRNRHLSCMTVQLCLSTCDLLTPSASSVFCFKCIQIWAELILTLTCQRGRACDRACDSGTEWRLRILSNEGIPEMASITGGGLSHWYHWRYYRFLSIYMQERHRSVLKGYLFLLLSIVPAKEPFNYPWLVFMAATVVFCPSEHPSSTTYPLMGSQEHIKWNDVLELPSISIIYT